MIALAALLFLAPMQRRSRSTSASGSARKNPDVRSADAGVDAAIADRNATASLLGPTLHIDAASLHWGDAFSLMLGTSAAVVRAQNTRSMTVTVVEPLTPLLAIFEVRGCSNSA